MKLSHPASSENSNLKVASIIDKENLCWQLEEISPVLKAKAEEILAVKAIQIPVGNHVDVQVWPFTKNGQYSVKSGYKIVHEEKFFGVKKGASSSQGLDRRIWKIAWSFDVVPKVGMFMWKCISDILPVMSNLRKKKAVQIPLCPICVMYEETMEHCFFHCDWVQAVWFEAPLNYKVDRQSITSFNCWLLRVLDDDDLHKGAKMKLGTAIAYTMWCIWKRRCSWIYDQIEVDSMIAIRHISMFLEEWRIKNAATDGSKKHKSAFLGKWEKPEEGVWRFNCDGSIKLPELNGGFGVVVRDCNGLLIDGANGDMLVNSVLAAEAFALKHAVKMAMQKSVYSAVFEIDSKELFDSIQDETCGHWSADHFIQDLRAMKTAFPSWSLSLVSRSCNTAADWVAGHSRVNECLVNWKEHPPRSLVQILTMDGLPGPPR